MGGSLRRTLFVRQSDPGQAGAQADVGGCNHETYFAARPVADRPLRSPLIIIRSLGEVFRLQYAEGDALTIAQVTPYVGSALFTTVILAAALTCHASALYRVVIGTVLATVALLLVYKIAVIG